MNEALDMGQYQDFIILTSREQDNIAWVTWQESMTGPWTARLVLIDGIWYIDALSEEAWDNNN